LRALPQLVTPHAKSGNALLTPDDHNCNQVVEQEIRKGRDFPIPSRQIPSFLNPLVFSLQEREQCPLGAQQMKSDTPKSGRSTAVKLQIGINAKEQRTLNGGRYESPPQAEALWLLPQAPLMKVKN
jgi:hypothetical protein